LSYGARRHSSTASFAKDKEMNFRQKYVPQSYDDLVIADPDLIFIVAEYCEGNLDHHLLLYGPPGTGKSEMARIIAEAPVRGGHFDRIHASDAAEEFEDRVLNSLSLQSIGASVRPCFVIDEVDDLPQKLQPTLAKLLENHSYGTFICTTNNIHRLNAKMADRMSAYKVLPPTGADCLDRAHWIMSQELGDCDKQLLAETLADFSGSIRQMMDFLELLVRKRRVTATLT
jgi:replication-associated recombination protein RarA